MSEHWLHFADGEDFFLAAEAFPAVIAAVRKAIQKEADAWPWTYELEKRLLSRPDPDDTPPRDAVERILDACGWQATFDTGGNITKVGLTKEASGCDALYTDYTDSLFWTLAPFVRHGSRVYMTENHAIAWVYLFRDGQCRVEYFHDYLQPDRMLVSYALLERLRAYLIASDVAGGGPAAELLADLDRALGR